MFEGQQTPAPRQAQGTLHVGASEWLSEVGCNSGEAWSAL